MPSSLGRRPQATALSVEDLIMRVRRGEVRVPRFQRRLKWRPKDIKLLFDSIYRGYPVGSLLFWKRAAPADSVKLGPITIDAPASRDAWWVVDGQQRITSLVGALLHPDPVHGRDEYALGIDLAADDFVRSRPSLPKSWMPLSVVLDTTALLRWLDTYELRAEYPEHVTTAHRVAKVLRDYQLPAYVIEEDDEAVVRIVFGRLNSAGRQLKPDEVFEALAGSEHAANASTLQAISDSVAEQGFGQFERAWILKSVQAVAGLDFTRSDVGALPRDKQVHAATQRALRDVAVFLRRDAGIQHASLLPYSLPIPLLAKYFHLHRSPRPRSRDLLSRWLWRGAITGDHQGQSIPQIRKMLGALDAPEEDAVQALLRLLSVAPTPGAATVLAPFAFRTARTKLEANALLALGPRDLTTGQPIGIPDVLDAQGVSSFRLIVPINTKNFDRTLKRKLGDTPLGTLANRFFYPSDEDFLLLINRALSKKEGRTALSSHGFSEAATNELMTVVFNQINQRSRPPASAMVGEPDLPSGIDAITVAKAKFLTPRTQLLERQVHRFLELKARWSETDRPSIGALTIPDFEGADA